MGFAKSSKLMPTI